MGNSNKYFIRSIRVIALIAATTISSNSMAASVWTLTGITDDYNNDSWSLHMLTESNTINAGGTISAVYFDNLSDGSVDVNFLLDNIDGDVRAALAGSTDDMTGNFSENDYPSTYFYAWGTQVDSETITNMSFFMSEFPLYDSAFFNNIRVESYGSNFGYGRLDDDFGTTNWFMSNTTATLTVSSVPVPAALWLFGSGLISLVGFARRKKA